MAIGTAQPGPSSPPPARDPRRGGRVVEYQQYIDDQLGRTRRRVMWVDLWTALTTLAVGFTAYLLVSAVIDHWIVPGGLGSVGRWLLMIGLAVGVAAQLVVGIGPIFARRVNPVYAAAALEQGGRMKNTLINFLLLRRRPEGVPDGVLDAMKEQAAVRLSGVPDDAPVDRTALIRWFYVLAAILVAAVGYALASPKDSFRSVRRVMTPWADLAAPTRVRFESITPGNIDKRRDDVVEVNVRAAGLRASDVVVLHYSASGNPADDVALPMQTGGDRYLWKAVLPGGSEGLKQDLFYYVQAGDAATERFRIRVLSTPVINVRSVRYDYPAYTGLPPRIVEKQGDLKALEGTRVSLVAEANQPIRAAHVAFDQARNKDVELKVDGLQATGGFDLQLGKDRATPVHRSYVLRFVNIDGEENPKPAEHRIEVLADQPPEVRVVEPNTPPEKEIALPLGGLLKVTLAARDPDFQLADLAVIFERHGALMREERMLAEPRYGEYSNTLLIDAERFNLKVGDKFTFRGRATDDKAPKPNVVETPRYTVVVTPPTGERNQNDPQRQENQPGEGQGDPQQQPPQNGQQPNEDARNQPGEKNDGRPQPKNGDQPPPDGATPNEVGTKPDGNSGNGQPTGPRGNDGAAPEQPPANPNERKPPGERDEAKPESRPQEPIDPNVDPGKAIDELNKHFEQQEKQDQPPKGDQPQDAPKQPNEGEPDQQQPKQSGEGSQPMPQESPGDKGDEKNEGAGEPKPDGSGEKGDKQDGAAAKQDGPKQDGAGDQGPPKPDGAAKPGEQPQAGGEKSADQPQPGGEPKSGDEAGGGGSQGGQPTEKQPGPDAGKGAEERQSGGSEGVGRQGAEGGGEKNSGGKAANEPAQNPGNEPPMPGGEGGTKTDDAAGGDAERRPGQNDSGTEAGKKPSDGASPEKNGGESPAKNPNEAQPQGTGSQGGDKPAPDTKGQEPSAGQAGEKPAGAEPAGEKSDPGARPNAEPNESQPGAKRDATSSDEGSGGKAGGDESKPDEKTERKNEENPDGSQGKPSANEKQPGGNTKNPGGTDGPASQNEGSPQQEATAKPRDKQGNPQTGNQQESSEGAKSPGSNSKHESDAQGDSSGDRSGEGEEGGGQKSPQKGTGAAGQNTAGDQGGAAASQEGDQATSDQGGDKVRSDDPSKGKPSQRQGEGTKTENGGEKAGGESPGSAASDDPANAGGGDRQTGAGEGGDQKNRDPGNRKPPGEQPSDQNGGPAGNGGGGNPDAPRNSDPPAERSAPPPGDEANLDYTRQVTELTLDRLKNQLDKGELDPELLKRFTSREALEEFVNRWESMRQAARDPSPAGEQAKQTFKETLKSLGLRPSSASQSASTAAGDDFRGVQGGRRSEPPAKFADQFRAYTTGVGQGEKQ